MNVNYNLFNHEPFILCGSPAQLTLKLSRSECQFSPLAVVHFLKIVMRIWWYQIKITTLSILITCVMDKVWLSLLHVSYFWELRGEGGNEKFNLFCVTVCWFFFGILQYAKF